MDSQLIQLLLPIIILQFILIIIALIDLKRVEATRGPKWLWVLIIILGNLAGPIIYFIIGRRP
ncbi:PLD nuclease N-terminal domain-containing protein [Alkalibacillus aidingensis]|uniref:PLD nuclease N-terminal domain-containing protein n=1 Tax=Alkalibacillus aidingensis TaxID=2747607 RepID=UPI0016607E35|nr:PLD nuclease N-terminal domain-containing protein [Alkalibacillus aidingensis]